MRPLVEGRLMAEIANAIGRTVCRVIGSFAEVEYCQTDEAVEFLGFFVGAVILVLGVIIAATRVRA
jgi:uncharacterized membrane protein